jgi:hypothetical protein
MFRSSQGEVMTGTVRSLNEFQVYRLFNCAVKDDETLVDAIVERLYRKMKEFDAKRAEDAVELIVDRDARAGSRLKALLDEVLPDRRAQAAASRAPTIVVIPPQSAHRLFFVVRARLLTIRRRKAVAGLLQCIATADRSRRSLSSRPRSR